jgi:transposase
MLETKLDGADGRFVERAVGERSVAADGRAAPAGAPDPELVERPVRRRFSAEYKLRILREAEACTRPGGIGALLRREGLYTSHLSAWRKQRDAGALEALGRPRGRKPADRRELELGELRRRAERAEAELAKARKVIEIQGNVSALLEQMLGTEGESGSTER